MHQEIKDRIIHLLEEIVGRAHSINQQDHGQEGLEIDLVMEDLRSLYRQFDLLRRQPEVAGEKLEVPLSQPLATSPEQGFANKALEEASEAVDPEPSEERERGPYGGQGAGLKDEAELCQPVQEEEPSVGEDKLPVPAEEIQPEPEPKKAPEPQPVKETPPEPPARPVRESALKAQGSKGNGPRSVLDLFADQSPSPSVRDSLAKEDNTLHNRIIAQKEDRSIGARLQMTPISSLKEAIGVNEKFLFINELFGGNIQVYNETIARLNSFKDMSEAFSYLNELNELLGWDEQRSAQTIEKLANFVQRRYMER
jgi:outer membrane biosynthesis protein TonB